MAAEHAEVVVVGSGFGGAVAAQRLAEAGRSVIVLERGRAYPPGSFARSPREMSRAFWDPAAGLHGLFQLHSFTGIDGLVSAGLGGGSLIYANVLIRKDERWFVHDQPHPDGTGVEHWPISRADLDPHYDRVERMLGATPFPYPDTAKTAAMREVAGRLGHEWFRPDLAVTFAGADGVPLPGAPLPVAAYGNVHGLPRRSCVLCGECDIGCNDGAKNTLDHTYLSSAAHHGAQLRTRAEVRRITPRDGGGYEVAYVQWGEAHDGVATDAEDVTHTTVTCDRLVLGAGAFGTTGLLLRNRSALPALGDALGTRFCGNGDLLGLAMRARRGDGTPWQLDAARSPVITSTMRLADEVDEGGRPGDRGFYLQDAGFPQFVEWVVESAVTPSDIGRAAGFAWGRIKDRLTDDADSDLSQEFAALLGDGLTAATSMPLLAMGRDVPDGTMTLRDGNLDVDWTTDTSMAFFERVREVMKDVAGELGAGYRDNLLWAFKRVITVHPLGGAPMGRHVGEGVVDAHGEAFGHPGLHVVDGAALPGPTGPNPSLTIAAFADRAAERILGAGPTVHAVPAVPTPATDVDQQADVPSDAPTLAFTEEMKGWVTLGATDFEQGRRQGRRDGTALMFRLTITMHDVARFVADPMHPGTAGGYVDCDALGGQLEVERGWFNLFVDHDEPDTTRMLYRLWFADSVGHPLTLTGFKTVHDDPGLDTWSDTSTLYVRVLRGHVSAEEEASAEVVASGIITIHLVDFLQQLTTFRATGTLAQRASSMADFGRLFLGELWETYGRMATDAVEAEQGAP